MAALACGFFTTQAKDPFDNMVIFCYNCHIGSKHYTAGWTGTAGARPKLVGTNWQCGYVVDNFPGTRCKKLSTCCSKVMHTQLCTGLSTCV